MGIVESREEKLELARQILGRIIIKNMIDDEDVTNLKNIAVWAVTELAHVLHNTRSE